jgi:hypothetical protein
MIVRVQYCLNGTRFLYRLLVCGGLHVYADDWTRETAREALNLLAVELPNVKRQSIRFVHT